MKTSLLILSAMCVLAHGQLDAANEQGKLRQENDAPKEFDVDPTDTYDSDFMGLMNSPCRPERDGYFGATSGYPTEIQFGFQMETLPLASITKMLDLIEDRVVDGVISTSFPTLCGFRRRELGEERQLESKSTTGASGFWFSKFNEVQTDCQPKGSPLNYCGTFTGKLQVYGKAHQKTAWDTLAILEAVLNNPTPSNIHEDLVSIQSEEALTAIVGEPRSIKSIDDDNNLSEVAKAGIILSVVVVICAAFYIYMEKKSPATSDGILKNISNSRKFKRPIAFYDRVLGRRFRTNRRAHHDNTGLAPSQYRDHKTEVLSLGARSTVALDDGRPDPLGYDTSDISESHNHLDEVGFDDECRPSLDPRAEFS